MILELIRHATMRIRFAGHRLLTDPCLAEAGTLPSYAGRSPNPLVPLPCPAAETLAGIDLVVVSHLHKDHFDGTAKALIPRDMPLVCQAADEARLREDGFLRTMPATANLVWNGIEVIPTLARHGTSAGVLNDMGTAAGFVLRAQGEGTLYWAGDTVWCEAVKETITRWRPDLIITHSGGAVWGGNELIVMDAAQTVAVCRHAPDSRVIAVHMEAFDHCAATRANLRRAARDAGIGDDRLLIPADGESLDM